MSDGPNIFQILGQLGEESKKLGDDIEKAKGLANYWSPENKENRKKEEDKTQRIRIREFVLIENFKKLLLSMIITTILLQVFFNKIVLWCGVQNNLMEFFVVTGIAVVLNAIIGIIIFVSS